FDSGLARERHVEDGDLPRLPRELAKTARDLGEDARVEERLEARERGRVVEDDRPELLPVHAASGTEDALPPHPLDLGGDLGPLELAVSELVGVEDHGAFLGEKGSDRRLSARDSSEEKDRERE